MYLETYHWVAGFHTGLFWLGRGGVEMSNQKIEVVDRTTAKRGR